MGGTEKNDEGYSDDVIATEREDKSHQLHFPELEARQEIVMRDTQVKLINEETNRRDERHRKVEQEFEGEARFAREFRRCMNFYEEYFPFGRSERVVRS